MGDGDSTGAYVSRTDSYLECSRTTFLVTGYHIGGWKETNEERLDRKNVFIACTLLGKHGYQVSSTEIKGDFVTIYFSVPVVQSEYHPKVYKSENF